MTLKTSDGFFMNTQEMPSVVEKKETAKAREFWIDTETGKANQTIDGLCGAMPHGFAKEIKQRSIHVIEYSAYEELKRQNEIMLGFIDTIEAINSHMGYQFTQPIIKVRQELSKCGKGGSV